MLSDKQKQVLRFMKDEGTISCLVGTIRSGKTYCATIAFGLNVARQSEPRLHLLLGRKLKVMEQEVLPTLKDVAKMINLKFDYSSSRQLVSFGNQRIIVTAGNDERSLDRIQGLTAHSALFDEATLLPESFFEAGLSRLSYNDSKAWVACNPSFPLHYIKKKYIDESLVDQHLNFTFKDNPSLGDKVIQRYESMFSGTFRKRMVEGLWCASDGLIFNEYKVDNQPEGRVIRTDAGMDYGIASPNAVVPVHTIRNGKDIHYHIPSVLYIDGGSEKRNLTDVQIGDKVFDYLTSINCSTLDIDPSAISIRNELLKRDGRRFAVRRANNDVPWGLRVSGAVLAHKPFTISPKATHLLDELQSYSWDPTKEDTPIKANDHCCDAMRYVLVKKFAHLFTTQTSAISIPEGM